MKATMAADQSLATNAGTDLTGFHGEDHVFDLKLISGWLYAMGALS